MPRLKDFSEYVDLQWQAMENWSGCCDRLPDLSEPVHLVTGDDDVLTPPENSIYLNENIPDSQLVIMNDGGHGLMYQYPSEMAETILTYLSQES